jgi:hypothetical protein
MFPAGAGRDNLASPAQADAIAQREGEGGDYGRRYYPPRPAPRALSRVAPADNVHPTMRTLISAVVDFLPAMGTRNQVCPFIVAIAVQVVVGGHLVVGHDYFTSFIFTQRFSPAERRAASSTRWVW